MCRETALALLATLSLAACSGAPPAAKARALPTKGVAPAPITEPSEPPPPLHRFATFPEDEEVQLFPLRGTPLLRVGSRIFSLRADQATREPGLEKILFDGTGKPWWRVLAGAFPGELYADRTLPGATPSSWPRAEVVRVVEGTTRALGAIEKTSGIVLRLVPLPDGRVLVTTQQHEGVLS
jgi:hypothetical protein